MKSFLSIFARLTIIGLIVSLTACRSKPGNDDISQDLYQDDFTSLDDTTGSFGGTELSGRQRIENMSPVSTLQAPVYFAFDSYTVAPGEVGKIQSIAQSLNSNPSQAVILKGHTDDRGSREYNVALGERRALAVRELLLTMGISPDRIQTLSMGQESPAVAGFDESAWSLNRRVEFQLMQ